MSMFIERKKLKLQLQSREPLFMAWTSLGHPQVTEMLLFSGVDCLGIDIEHTPISQEQCQRIIAACHASRTPCLPRVASHNREAVRRLLDSGADGVMVPTVETPGQIESLIEWIKYPPEGKRGYGVARAQGYGHDFAEYTSTWNETSILIIQIETISAVEKISELINFDEVDGVMVGPYDLSGSLAIPGQIDHPLVEEAISEVYKACKKFNKACGVHEVDPSLKSVKKSFAGGASFVVLSSDLFALWKWGERMKQLITDVRS